MYSFIFDQGKKVGTFALITLSYPLGFRVRVIIVRLGLSHVQKWAIHQKWVIPEKNWAGVGGGGWLKNYFFENPLEFLGFLLYTWKFQIKQGFIHPLFIETPQKLHPSEILRPETTTPVNSTRLFLDYLWKFHVVFN